MSHSKAVLDFWDRVKEETGIKGMFQDAWGFGDTPRLTDELLALVLDGKKRTTTTLVKEMEAEGYPEPKEGEYSIILDGSGEPRAVIRTVSVRRARFSDVDEDHAYWEGEDDRTLESYRREHTKYYRRRGEALGFAFSDDMEVILERFELVYP
ncbi:MAG TPA: ASCH domain-containing protein [Candidatus Bathyarchaeia archaeon]